MKSLDELIQTRRTVHQFKSDIVSEDVVHHALELSLWAPNHRLTFPWVYTLVSAETRLRLIDLAIDLKKKKDPEFSKIKEMALRKRLGEPSHWVALGLKRDPRPEVFQEDVATLGCSVQIASMSLWENGISTKWSTGGFTSHSKTYEILNLSESEVCLMGALFIGVADVLPQPSPRPPLSEVLKRK